MTPLVLAGLAGLTALVVKLVDVGRMVTNFRTQRSALATQGLAWAAGIGATFLYSASQFGATVTIEGLTVDHMGGWTKVLVGMSLASVGSVVVDLRQALDNQDSAAKPPLVPPPSATSAPVAASAPYPPSAP